MRKISRILAFLLVVLMTLQGVAFAAENAPEPIVKGPEPEEELPLTEEQEDPEIDIPGPAEPVEIEIEASLEDGQVVNNPQQILMVTAGGNGIMLDPSVITVKLGSNEIELTDGGYPLVLERGENIIEITAETASVVLHVDYEIAIPEGWAKDALAFCVDYGILNGNQYGDLCPTDRASRAQLAAMLVRLFAAENEADLSGYQDMKSDKWYYKEMARAVAMGLFEGSSGKLTPENSITREQAFTVLARAFGVGAKTEDALKEFPDADQVSSWARCYLAAMLEAGYIHGSSGKLNPKGYITRQELAQVLYNALDCITDDPDQINGTRNLYTGPIEGLAGKTIDGNLILSGSGSSSGLDGFTVTGRLVLLLQDMNEVSLGEVSSSVSVCSPLKLTLTSPVDTLVCLRDGATIKGNADTAINIADVTYYGEYNELISYRGSPTLTTSARVGYMDVAGSASGSTVNNYGDVQEFHARARKLTLAQDGHIGTLYQYHNDLQNACNTDEVIRCVDAGLEGITITPVKIPEVYYDDLKTTVTGKITGVNFDDIYGVPDGVRTVTVTYRYKGKIVKVDNNFKLTENAELSCTFDATLEYRREALQPVTVTISYKDETCTGTLNFKGMGRWTYLHDARNITEVHNRATILYTTTLYAYSSLTYTLGSVTAGTVVHFLKFDNGGNVALIETPSGTRAWVAGSAVEVCWAIYHNDDVSYSPGAMEAFVNELKQYSSSTKYLVWVNLYTTTVNIFEGSKGNWKLIKSAECDIGAPNSPTRPGKFTIYSKSYYWSFDSSSANDVDRCYYASLFDGGIALHTRLYYTGTHNLVDARLSCEISHGCVRCPDDIAQFIYYNCPLGTAVVVC